MAVRNPLGPAVLADPLTSPEDPTPGDFLARAQALLGHDFSRPALLREALTHRSALAVQPGRRGARGGAGSNERLEFIGDRVLGLLVAEWLAERFPEEQEGELGRRLAHLVAQPVLASVAEAIGLAATLSVAPGEARAGVKRLATVLADAMEAVIGAIYLDGGIAPARNFVRLAWRADMETLAAPPKDAKTALQEWAQARGLPLPAYLVAAREGPPHAPRFRIEVTVAGQTGSGTGTAKRAAEQDAASDLLAKLA